MPRISNLPLPTERLNSDEITAVVKNGVTEQRKVYELQSIPVDGYSSNFYFTLNSLQERTSLAGLKFFNDGVQIDPQLIVFRGFSRGTNIDGETIDIQLEGTLEGLFTDNPNNDTSWKTNFTDICLHIAFNDFVYIDEVQITATLTTHTTAPITVKVDIGDGRLFNYYNYVSDSWTPGAVQSVFAPILIEPLFPIGLTLKTISGARNYSEIYERKIMKRINISSPFLVLNETEESTSNFGTSQAYQMFSQAEIEIQTHRQNVLTITNTNTVMDESWMNSYANYSFTYFIMNAADDAIIDVKPSEDKSHRFSQVGVKRTIINVTGGFDVTVLFNDFDTYKESDVTILPGQILHYIEYDVGKVFSWIA